MTQLADIRGTGAPISLATVRCVIIALIQTKAPEIFLQEFKDGSKFQVSDSFCRKFLHKTLAWSMQKGTKAAQKLPVNAEEQCENAFLRRAWLIKEHSIPAEFVINADQTGVVYLPGSRMTWAPIGSKQVSMIGNEEKRAFTTLLAINAAVGRLPIQCVYEGRTNKSTPKKSAPYRKDCDDANFHFIFSGTGNHWSNQKTMREWVELVVIPYLERERERLGLHPNQKALLIIDVWSVHRSAEFQDWMRENYPNIIIDFIPGGCTGIGQPLDVGINRPFKHAVKVAYHAWLVETLIEQRSKGKSLDLDTRIGTLRNASVAWIWQGFRAIENRELLLKVSTHPPRNPSLMKHRLGLCAPSAVG
jgi:hypothetical protein